MGRTSHAKEKLIEGTRELLHLRGYRDVGVNELCERAGVKKGSFYYFFDSKKDLSLAAVNALWEDYRNALEAIFTAEKPHLARLEDFLLAGYRDQCRMQTEYGRLPGCPFGNLALEMGGQDETLRLRLSKIFETVERYLERELRLGIEAGEIEPIDAGAVARALLAYQEGCFLSARTRNDPDLLKSLLQQGIRLVVTDAPRS